MTTAIDECWTHRALAVMVAVFLWMALGFALHLRANAYLLIGVPIVIVFQLIVKRHSRVNVAAPRHGGCYRYR
jgi:hypothetical protein